MTTIMIDHFVIIADSAMADEAFLHRIKKIRKRGLLVYHAYREKDGFRIELDAFETCFKRSIQQLFELGHGVCNDLSAVFYGLGTHAGYKLAVDHSVRITRMIVRFGNK